MDERVTENFQPYEPEPSYDWDYDDAPRHTPKILWGRVGILGAALLVAFLIGRATAPEGISQTELAAAKNDISELQTQVDDLQSQLDEANAAAADTTPADDTGTADEGTADEGTTEETAVAGETYKVKSGDTIRGIAQTFCGDPEFADQIMELNGISDATQLSVGAEIEIPAECS